MTLIISKNIHILENIFLHGFSHSKTTFLLKKLFYYYFFIFYFSNDICSFNFIFEKHVNHKLLVVNHIFNLFVNYFV